MTFRTRLSLAFLAGAVLPLALLAHGVRGEVTRQLTAQYERRVSTLVDVVRQDLTYESASTAIRLAILRSDLSGDDRFRLGAVHGDPIERRYVLDWAERAMSLAGLSVLRVYDESDRIVTSGHFRNEYGRADSSLPARISAAPGGHALLQVRAPSGGFVALVRTDSVRVGGRVFVLVGGTTVDDGFFARLERDGELDVTLVYGAPASPAHATLPLQYVRESADTAAVGTHLAIAPLGDELGALRRDVDRWIAGTFVLAALAGAMLVAWLAGGLSRPLATLARAALSIEFDTPDVTAVASRTDEVGTVARRFAAMTRRLRAGAVRLRDAERRATAGEMARQVNHDVKNGLVPIRNVLRHLTHVQETTPQALSAVFAERRGTLDASVAYLDELATRWSRLAPRADRRPVDVHAVVTEAAAAARDAFAVPVDLRLDAERPVVFGDPVAIRRILDNVVTNAAQSIGDTRGSITIHTQCRDGVARITLVDTGSGMTPEQLARALAGFYTTKPNGTGLGLSVVRRLVSDHGGSVQVSSAPGRGTTVSIELPTQRMPAQRPLASRT
ncbi:MAG: ATP-binding protein [Gemmatimonadaceae bacterium]